MLVDIYVVNPAGYAEPIGAVTLDTLRRRAPSFLSLPGGDRRNPDPLPGYRLDLPSVEAGPLFAAGGDLAEDPADALLAAKRRRA